MNMEIEITPESFLAELRAIARANMEASRNDRQSFLRWQRTYDDINRQMALWVSIQPMRGIIDVDGKFTIL